MAKNTRSKKGEDRRRFDLQTVRGWGETVGVFVATVGAIVTIYFQVFSNGSNEGSRQSESQSTIDVSGKIVQKGTGNIIGSGNNITIITYTDELYVKRLKKREAELILKFEQSEKQAIELRTSLEQELTILQRQFVDIEKSYKDRIAELIRIAKQVESFSGDVSEDKIKQAVAALAEGNSDLADAIFAEVENSGQNVIESTARAAYERGRIAHDNLRWQDAGKFFEKADRLHPNQPLYAQQAARQARVIGDYEAARSRYKSILNHRVFTEGEEVTDKSNTISSLAEIYRILGKYKKSVQYYKVSIDMEDNIVPHRQKVRANLYNELALTYEAQGLYSDAESLIKKSIAIDEETLPAGHTVLSVRYATLGVLYHSQKRYSEAQPWLEKAVAIQNDTLPKNHPHIAIGYNNLAETYRIQNRYQDAERLYKQAIDISELTLPASHPDLGAYYGNLAKLYRNMGRYKDAKAEIDKSILIADKTLPADHPLLANRYAILAAIYRDDGDYQLAETFYEKAMDILVAKHGKSHPRLITVAKDLANVLDKMDRKLEAGNLRKEYGI